MYQQLRTLEDLHVFLQHHVFAVWDFMSLLKGLQRSLTSVEIPWLPGPDRHSRRLINEIVLEEESDEDGSGSYLSHFELYVEAMLQCGADTGPIETFVSRLREGDAVANALVVSGAPAAARRFVEHTFRVVEEGDLVELAAAFTLGREDVIPDMFRALISDLSETFPNELTILRDYLDRHIQLDEERHHPMALEMLETICGRSRKSWDRARETAASALTARIDLWDGVLEEVRARQGAPTLSGVV